jgi:hypothetical protein
MLTYADVCWRMQVCSEYDGALILRANRRIPADRMQPYAAVC